MAWRDFLRVHPACELFPMMTPAELKELGADIKAAGGLKHPIVLWRNEDGEYSLLDGRNRLDAMEAAKIKVAKDIEAVLAKMNVAIQEAPTDPYEYVISVNLHRRHLTAERKRDMIAEVLKARPELSDRAVASKANVDHKTVAPIRRTWNDVGKFPTPRRGPTARAANSRRASPSPRRRA
jgi:hypothetical protein